MTTRNVTPGGVRATDRKPMSDTEVIAFIRREFDRGQGGVWPGRAGTQITSERNKNMKYYNGDKLGNEVEGRSQIVTRDCFEAVETALPDLIESFFASEYVGEFEPTGPGKEQQAKQATEFCHHVFLNDNPGFLLTYNFVKNGLIGKNGLIKVMWETEDKQETKQWSGLTDDELQVSLDSIEGEYEITERAVDDDGLLSVTADVHTEKKRCRLYSVPPEQIIVSDRANNTEYPNFLCHVVRKTRYEMIEEGLPKDIVMACPVNESPEWAQERRTRFQGLANWRDNRSTDPLNDKLWYYESYAYMDADGDGKAEYRQVITIGPSHMLISNEPFPYHPFVYWTPIPMPDVFFGQCLVDVTRDLQEAHTTIARQWLDNMYNVNNARSVFNERIDLDDMLSNRVGNQVQATGEEPVQGCVEQLVTQSLAPYTAPLIEYVEDRKEARTGMTRENSGLDVESLNKAASGIAMIMAAGQARPQLMKRILAETGMKQLFKVILKVLIMHQDKPRMVRIRGQWTEFDPRYWDADMDFNCHVGLGHGTRQQKVGAAQTIVQLQKQIIEMQQGVSGPFVYMEQAYNALENFLTTAGEKTPEKYISAVPDIKQQMQLERQKPKEPNPLEIAAKADAQKSVAQAASAQAKAANDQRKLQVEALNDAGKLQLQKEQSDRDYSIDVMKLVMENQKVQGEQIERLTNLLDSIQSGLNANVTMQ